MKETVIIFQELFGAITFERYQFIRLQICLNISILAKSRKKRYGKLDRAPVENSKISTLALFNEDFFHPADDTACQANLDAMAMGGRFCENILYDAFRQFPGALVLLLDNLHMDSRFNVGPICSAHL